jgi:3,4-dihydroxy-2-butanone 4-phosphate synthase
MASQTSKAKSKAVPLAKFVTDIDHRRAETGITDLPRNSGTRRTASKRALLKAIEEAGGKW